MYTDLANIALGFLEGLALIVSPCILPILPIILAGSLTGGQRRPLGIICGFVLIFSLFTFFSRALVEYSGLDLNWVRDFAYGLLLILSIIMMSNYLTEKFSALTRGLANVGSNWSVTQNPKQDFMGGLILGSLVALVWTPCAGPILAAVIVQTVIQKTSLLSFFTILAFALGAAGPMLIIALFGRRIMPKFQFFMAHSLLFRKLMGAIIFIAVLGMIYSNQSLATLSAGPTTKSTINLSLENALAKPYPAPEIAGISAWINSPPLQLKGLRGKVVLIDFWTYSCINCLRTLPYIKAWYAKYHPQGLVIIGIHTPEFDFEKDLANVKAAVIKDGIEYPVALDSQFVTWRNFNNAYWPAHYLIDQQGQVVYTHFGEGDYDTTENNIRYLLGLKPATPQASIETNSASAAQTPETYFGYERAQAYASPQKLTPDQNTQYSFPTQLALNAWGLAGNWTVEGKRIISMSPQAKLELHFIAGKVFIVMGSLKGEVIPVKLLLNGKPLTEGAGKDVRQSIIPVKEHRLYEVLDFKHFQEGILELQASAPDLEIYTFTFGSS